MTPRRSLGRRTAGRLLTALTVGFLVTAGPAAATPVPEVQGDVVGDIQVAPGSLEFVYTATGLAEGVFLDPASVQVAFGGRDLEAQAVPISDAPTQVSRTAVLTMDISGSMETDNRIGAARDAATAFLNAVPADVLVGLVTFGNDARVAVPPTTNRAQVQAAINGLGATDDFTALYDGVSVGVATAGSAGLRQVLLLTDGVNDDPTPTTSLDAVLNQVSASGVQLNAVALPGSDVATLNQFAAAGNGQVFTAVDPATSSQFFAEQAAAISRQLGVQAVVPPSLADTPGFLDVTARSSDNQTVSYRTEITTLPVTTPSPTASPTTTAVPELTSAPGLGIWDRLANVWLLVGLAALFGGLAVLLVLAFASVPVGRSNQVQLRRRLAFYSLGGAQPVKESETSISLSDTPVGRSVVGLAGRLMQRRDLETVLAQRMESAGVPLKPAEWLLLHVGTAVVLALVLLLAFGGRLIPMLIGLIAGLVIPWAYLVVKEGRRHRDFQAQMPDALQLTAGSLSAGYSLPQAIDTVVREGQNPISSEFNRALVETRLGVPLEDALDGVATRMNSADFRWVVMALRIQRDVGGNLAEVLSTVSTTMRERARLNRQIEVLSAEGRLSGWILCGLPLAFIVYLLLVQPEYLEPLYTTRLGVAMLVLSGVLLVVGALWMRRVVKVEV